MLDLQQIRMRLLRNVPIIVLAVTIGTVPNVGADERNSGLEASGCFLRLKDQAQIPARERGVLKAIMVSPGDLVEEAQLVASLEDQEVTLALQLAEIDLEVARTRQRDSVAVGIAESAIEESKALRRQAEIDHQISTRLAESSVAIRHAEAAAALAKDGFDRVMQSRREFRTSVSGRELATVQYELDKSGLDVEQARDDQSLQALRASGQAVLIEQQKAISQRLALELSEARMEHGIASLTVQRMMRAVDVAREQVARHRMKSPLTGVVVEKLRHTGEWVEAGDPVLRVVRLDRLYAEGYVDAKRIDQSFRGRRVTVEGETRTGIVTVSGVVVFVSPEIDSVNQQVQVRAEVENDVLTLRPGQPVRMWISRDGSGDL